MYYSYDPVPSGDKMVSMNDHDEYQESDIPLTPTRCRMSGCVYRGEDGICDEPQINYGNGDAVCHALTPLVVLRLLGIL